MSDRTARVVFAVLYALSPAITLAWLLAILWFAVWLGGGHGL